MGIYKCVHDHHTGFEIDTNACYTCLQISGVAQGDPGRRGLRVALLGGRHFADEKLTFERNLKVLAFRYYFKYIFNVLTLFTFRV